LPARENQLHELAAQVPVAGRTLAEATHAGAVNGLNTIFLISALMTFAGAAAAWPLLGGLRPQQPELDDEQPATSQHTAEHQLRAPTTMVRS
jgi:hypothetical protein